LFAEKEQSPYEGTSTLNIVFSVIAVYEIIIYLVIDKNTGGVRMANTMLK